MGYDFLLLRRDGVELHFNQASSWLKKLVKHDADMVLFPITEEALEEIHKAFYEELILLSRAVERTIFESHEWHGCIKKALVNYPEVCNVFTSATKSKNADLFAQICTEMKAKELDIDTSNGPVNGEIASCQRGLIVDALEKVIYSNYHLTEEQRQAYNEGYIYVHDMGHRRDMINCCLFDMEKVLEKGFSMGDMWYEEPTTLREAFELIALVTMNGAAQIYGGFTITEIDKLLAKYAQKSYVKYMEEYQALGLEADKAEAIANKKLEEDFEKGFWSLETRFNAELSPQGASPFITITFGLGRDKYAQMASRAALKIRQEGHGKEGFKRPVLFPKLVFLYDKALHDVGKELYPLFQKAIICSSKVMYPEYLSLTGEKGLVSEVYKKYGKVISPMCCRAFLTQWFERGGEALADAADQPVFVGRFNYGVVSLNLPMILAKSKESGQEFFKTLDYYLELARQIHKTTYRFLAEKRAYTNPLAFMEGGLYGGHLKRNDKIEPLLKSATASFGITALNELQRLYNGKSLVEDGAFALETAEYINAKIAEFTREDHIQYSVYGTPAETLCGRQAKQFDQKYGEAFPIIAGKAYFSNSFHCHVSEDITPIEKQDYEARFWDLCNGGKIQYIRLDVPHNTEALEALVKHAMELGLYEGVNISLGYCEECGWQWTNEKEERPQVCPHCGKDEITLIDRMCGFISFTRIHGRSRLNPAKMEEIRQRKSM